MTSEWSHNELDEAYIGEVYQMRLFKSRPREVCREIGLNWLAASYLYNRGWLSFDPEVQRELSEPEEAELRFVGSLVACGFDESQPASFLEGLRKPYRYRVELMYFDFLGERWRRLPSPCTAGLDEIREAIDTLREEGEVDDLRSLQEEIAEALEELQSMKDEEDEGNT